MCMYINKLDENMGDIISEFADNMKIGSEESGTWVSWKDRQSSGRWNQVNVWCSILGSHFLAGHVNGRNLGNVDVQRDLFVQVHSSLKW